MGQHMRPGGAKTAIPSYRIPDFIDTAVAARRRGQVFLNPAPDEADHCRQLAAMMADYYRQCALVLNAMLVESDIVRDDGHLILISLRLDWREFEDLCALGSFIEDFEPEDDPREIDDPDEDDDPAEEDDPAEDDGLY